LNKPQCKALRKSFWFFF